jgi:hypothetical protein
LPNLLARARCAAAAEWFVQRLVPDQPRTSAPMFQHEFARVKCFELDTMRDADERC